MGSDKKWIYLSYILAILIVGWVLNQIVTTGLLYLRWTNPRMFGLQQLTASALASYCVTAAAAYFYFRQEKVTVFSNEVMQELRKVTWPNRQTAYKSTVVVVVAVILVAAILGVFDWFCAGLIRLVLRF